MGRIIAAVVLLTVAAGMFAIIVYSFGKVAEVSGCSMEYTTFTQRFRCK